MTQEEYRDRFVESLNKSVDDLGLEGEMREQFIKTAIYFYDMGGSDCEKSHRIDWELVLYFSIFAVATMSLVYKIFV